MAISSLGMTGRDATAKGHFCWSKDNSSAVGRQGEYLLQDCSDGSKRVTHPQIVVWKSFRLPHEG